MASMANFWPAFYATCMFLVMHADRTVCKSNAVNAELSDPLAYEWTVGKLPNPSVPNNACNIHTPDATSVCNPDRYLSRLVNLST